RKTSKRLQAAAGLETLCCLIPLRLCGSSDASPFSIRQAAQEDVGDQIRVFFDRGRAIGEEPLIEDREVRFDEHRRDVVRIDVAKNALLDALANHARRFVHELAITIAAEATARHARDLALIKKDAKQIAPLIEVAEVSLGVRAQFSIR